MHNVKEDPSEGALQHRPGGDDCVTCHTPCLERPEVLQGQGARSFAGRPARNATSQQSDDRGQIMTLRTKTALILFAIVSTMAVSTSYARTSSASSRANGKVCLNCHEDSRKN